MQSIAGCITTATKITNGNLSIRNLQNVTLTNLNQNHDQQDVVKLSPRLNEYNVILSSGEPMYILAANAEEAAWSALELSEDRQCKLINVMLSNEW